MSRHAWLFSHLQWVGSLFALGGTHTHRHIHTAPPAHAWLDVSIVASFLTCMMRWEKRVVTGGAEMCLIALPLVDPLFCHEIGHAGYAWRRWGGMGWVPTCIQTATTFTRYRRKDQRIEPGGVEKERGEGRALAMP